MSERVVCVDDSVPPCGYWAGDPVVLNREYTIIGREMIEGDELVLLREIKQGGYSARIGRCLDSYFACRFRPINDDRIDIFRSIDRDVFDRVPA